MSGFATVIYEKEEGIATITLNRPQALNSFSVQMRDDLYAALNAVRVDDDVKVAIIREREKRPSAPAPI
jgi:enoyl-CoA hydratase/carnithine racemase